jgi:hypothetical protein
MKRNALARFFLQLMVCFFVGLVVLPGAEAQQNKPATKSEEEKNQPPVEKRERVQKIFEIKHADIDQLAEVLRLFAPIQANRQLRVIAVSASRDVVAAVEDAIKRFDVPPPATKNIEMTVYLLMALSEQTGAKNTPAELEGVLKQLRSVFTYQGFRLLDTLVVRSRNGMPGEVNGVAPKNPDEVQPTFYRFSFGSASITMDNNTGRMIRIDNLRLGAKVTVKTGSAGPANFTMIDTGINTNIDVREGQKVVVGKATIDGSNNVMFLVLTAKVVD